MRLSWRWLGRAMLLLPVVLLAAGCSGVNATGTVSPLMFLVPGLGQTTPPQIAPPTPVDSPNPEAPLFAQSK